MPKFDSWFGVTSNERFGHLACDHLITISCVRLCHYSTVWSFGYVWPVDHVVLRRVLVMLIWNCCASETFRALLSSATSLFWFWFYFYFERSGNGIRTAFRSARWKLRHVVFGMCDELASGVGYRLHDSSITYVVTNCILYNVYASFLCACESEGIFWSKWCNYSSRLQDSSVRYEVRH